MNKKLIWKALQEISQGKVVTYGSLAKRFNTSPQAIGSILHSNKHPEKIPCYKVVKSDGSLGGYSLGINKKIEKLAKDGIIVSKGKVVSFESVIYSFDEE